MLTKDRSISPRFSPIGTILSRTTTPLGRRVCNNVCIYVCIVSTYCICSVCIYVQYVCMFLNLSYSRWTSLLPSCLWSVRIFSPLPGSRLTIFYRDARQQSYNSSTNGWILLTHVPTLSVYGRKNTNPTLVRIDLTTSAPLFNSRRCAGYLLDHSGDECMYVRMYVCIFIKVNCT